MFKLNVLTPEKKAVFDQEIAEVTVPAQSGEMTILPGHSPMVATLGTGILHYRTKDQNQTHKAVISWGYCEVTPHGVNVLAEFMQTADEVETAAAQQQIQNAEKKLATEALSDEEFEETMNQVAKARAAMDLVKH